VRVLLRLAVGLLSMVVLAACGLGWVQLKVLDRVTPSAAVIEGPPLPAGEQNILLVGLDTRTDAQGNRLPDQVLDALNAGDGSSGGGTADSLTVVHVPAGGGRATAISIPRDAYVDLGQGLGRHKINSAWSRAAAQATEAMTESAGPTGSTSLFAAEAAAPPSPDDPAVVRAASAAGARATIGAVQQLTGLPISHFAAVNLAGFSDVSTAIGGVPVCLRAPTQDPYTGVDLPAGPQEISGPQALAFVRQRHGLPGGDIDRIARQQVFLAGATDKLLSTGTLTDPFAVSRITAAVSRSVTLDAGWDVLAFARQMQGLSAGAVTFRTIPTGSTELSTPYDGTAVKVDPETVRTFVATAIAADAGNPAAVAALAPPPPVGASDASVSARQDRLAVAGSEDDASSEEDDASRSDDADEESRSEDGATASPTPPVSPTPPITAAAPGCIN
jgi:LCP family protein required for cell wall assembly